MPFPTDIKFHFPEGLSPSVYSNVCAVLEGRRTSGELALVGELDRCRGALTNAAIDLGITPHDAVKLLYSEGFEGNNFAALSKAIVQAATVSQSR